MKFKKATPIKSDVINTKKHIFVGVVWNILGSKGNEYEVTMEDAGFTCTCPASSFHRGKKCKHISQVELKLCGE